jgi:outer membrane lipoprotein carrier protein
MWPTKISIRTLLFAAALATCAAGPATGDEELDQLIRGLQSRYSRMISLSADFTQIYTAPGERTRRETGQMLLRKPGKMRWNYTSPEPKLFISDGRMMYEYVPAEHLATRVKVKESADLRAPFMFLLGRGDLRKDFSRIEFSDEAPARAGSRVVQLLPKRNEDFRALIVEVDPASLRIGRLSIVDQRGGRSDFLFSNVRENVSAPDDEFVFKAPSGVEIRDAQ